MPIQDVDGNTPDTQPQASACCGGPAPAGTDACCVRDADVKAGGGNGCGCGATHTAAKQPAKACCR